jgi:hypothetical protein
VLEEVKFAEPHETLINEWWQLAAILLGIGLCVVGVRRVARELDGCESGNLECSPTSEGKT